MLRARQRQRELLSLLAHGDPKVPGALVVDHPAAAAYCLPGLRSAIVISAGTLDLLDADELAAVLAHERAHLRERHDLVLLPFLALLRAFRWAGVARQAYRAVGLLVEMHADDRACQHRPARELATALLRVGAAGGGGVPSGALAAASRAEECEVAARVIRLLRPAPGLSNARGRARHLGVRRHRQHPGCPAGPAAALTTSRSRHAHGPLPGRCGRARARGTRHELRPPRSALPGSGRRRQRRHAGRRARWDGQRLGRPEQHLTWGPRHGVVHQPVARHAAADSV